MRIVEQVGEGAGTRHPCQPLSPDFSNISTNNAAYSDGIPNCGNKSSLFIRESLLGA